MFTTKARFLVLFIGLLTSSFSLLSIRQVNDSFVDPYTAGVARASGLLLHLAGEPVEVTGTLIRGNAFAVNLRNGCNGLEALLIFVAAVLAHPARSAGALVAGSAAIQLANLLRVGGLYLIGLHQPELFSLVHTVVAQTAIVLLASLLFFFLTARKPSVLT